MRQLLQQHFVKLVVCAVVLLAVFVKPPEAPGLAATFVMLAALLVHSPVVLVPMAAALLGRVVAMWAALAAEPGVGTVPDARGGPSEGASSATATRSPMRGPPCPSCCRWTSSLPGATMMPTSGTP